jgi:hypothetical protein
VRCKTCPPLLSGGVCVYTHNVTTMRDFGTLDPEQLHRLMLFALAAWMLGRAIVRPFVPPQTMTAMGMGEILRRSR